MAAGGGDEKRRRVDLAARQVQGAAADDGDVGADVDVAASVVA